MTEQEWLASNDPAAMLDWRQGSNPLREPCPLPPLSGRKLRLWVEACRERFEPETAWATDVDLSIAPQWWANWSRVEGAGAEAAALLRDIVGNPWRPVALPLEPCPRCGKGEKPGWVWGHNHAHRFSSWFQCGECKGSGTKGACPWLAWNAAAVPRLAQAAYDGRGADGTLDAEALAVLADALEEAGCPGAVACDRCDRPVIREVRAAGGEWSCAECQGSGLLPHPLLAHLRSPGPHVRGCHAVDLLLGRE